ncbi:uncharacterized protein [Palaemon carinicauda]|uniref:uncharacterized protein isoform X2 n=1 Tax=Palaemon carinicauda TaxID=392227 RepID=UPI0035B5B1DD
MERGLNRKAPDISLTQLVSCRGCKQVLSTGNLILRALDEEHGMGKPWVLWIILIVICVWSGGLALRTNNDKSRATQLRLMTKAGETEALPRRGTAIREKEIAAIFRGVAYGAPTQGRPNSTIPSVFIIPSGISTVSSFVSTAATVEDSYSVKNLPLNPESAPNPERGKNSSITSAQGEKNVGIQDKTNSAIVSMSTLSPKGTSSINHHTKSSSENETGVVEVKGIGGNGNQGSADLRWNLGFIWWVQVYMSVGLFTLLAIVTLFLMARFAIASHLLPRPHYLVLHLLIFFTAFLRSLHTLHDSHTLRYVLPVFLLAPVEESIWPCLTAALALVLVAVLRVWRNPRHPHLALALALVTAVHLITLPAALLAAALLKEEEDLPIKTTTRAVTAAWGGTVGMGGIWAVWRESRDYSSQMTDVRVNNSQENCPNVAYPARLVFTAAFTQLLLAGLHVYTLLMPVSPEGHIWLWWFSISISRGLELVVCSTLVSAAALTLDRPNQCCVFRSCCQKRTVEIVHPTEIKMIHPMGVYTLQPVRPKNEHAQTIAALSLSNAHKEKRNHSSLDYVTSDFQLVWNHNRQRPLTGSQTTHRLIGDDIPRAHILPLAPRSVMEPFVNNNAFSSTLPRNRMYASPSACLQFEEEEIKNSQERGINYNSKSSTLLSESSGSSKLYSSPQIPLRTSRSWDELSTGHVYEDPMKAKPGSVDEGLSDLSDMNSDNINDLFFNETCSPVLLRPKRRSRRRHHTACYLSARHFTTHQAGIHPGHMIPHSSKSSDQKLLVRQNATQHTPSDPSSFQKSSDYSVNTSLPGILPPPPFLSSAQNTSTIHCGSLHLPSSAQTSSIRHGQTGQSRPKLKSKPDHHEGF